MDQYSKYENEDSLIPFIEALGLDWLRKRMAKSGIDFHSKWRTYRIMWWYLMYMDIDVAAKGAALLGSTDLSMFKVRCQPCTGTHM